MISELAHIQTVAAFLNFTPYYSLLHNFHVCKGLSIHITYKHDNVSITYSTAYLRKQSRRKKDDLIKAIKNKVMQNLKRYVEPKRTESNL